jgi:hypothetical protein
MVRHVCIAASLLTGCPPRLPDGAAYLGVDGSNQTFRAPRFLSEVSKADLFRIWQSGGQALTCRATQSPDSRRERRTCLTPRPPRPIRSARAA